MMFWFHAVLLNDIVHALKLCEFHLHLMLDCVHALLIDKTP